MLTGMRELGLNYLLEQLQVENCDNIEEWYEGIRLTSYYSLFPFLVEDSKVIERVYILEDYKKNMAIMSIQDLNAGENSYNLGIKIPFVKPSGSQSGAIGPIIKRSINEKKKVSPSEKIINTTVKNFEQIAESDAPWASYFQEITNVLKKDTLRLPNGKEIKWKEEGYSNMISCAVNMISGENKTVFLTIRNSKGEFPGENPLYCDYLSTYQKAGEKYTTQNASGYKNGTCYLCGRQHTTVFPNALRGAGINIKNLDRVGNFPGLDIKTAWKGYGICGGCADLLYIYKFHVLSKRGPKNNIQPFTSWIAGDKALIVPTFLPGLTIQARRGFQRDVNKYVNSMNEDVTFDEDSLLHLVKDNDTIINITVLWAEIGQEIKGINGMITNVLPSRLKELSLFNQTADSWNHPIFPKHRLSSEENYLIPNLSLKALKCLFIRPGGKTAKKINQSKQLLDLKRRVAECVYYKTELPMERFWNEVMVTANWHWLNAVIKRDGHNQLIYEGMGKKGPFLTTAGWVRHLAWWLYYFKQIGVMEMEKEYFEPKINELKPYFGSESGIDTKPKAFAFLLGILYGKVMQVQGGKGVNVGANALTWLKRLTLTGKDLPEFYIKIRQKLLAYETEGDERVRRIIGEVGSLGIELGDNIKLNDIQTNYFLLLGQSIATDILPKKESATKKQRSVK